MPDPQNPPSSPKIILGDDWKKPAATTPPAPAPGAPAGADSGSKIVIDSDWKSQAQAEKERLAETERAKQAAKRPSGGPGTGSGGAGADGRRELPPADFQSLMGTLVSQALMYLGGFPDPETGQAMVSLDYARLYIDLLGVLETKTKGNLTPEESNELTQVVNELRMRYVEISKMIVQAAAKQRAGGAGGIGGPGGGAMGMGGMGGVGGMGPAIGPR